MNYKEVKDIIGISGNINVCKSDFSPGTRIETVIYSMLDRIQALEKEVADYKGAIYSFHSDIRDLKEQ